MASESRRPRRLFLSGAVVAGACAALPTVARAQSQAGRTSFVLVHGAWHGGWCWRRVSDRLTANGHHVAAPTLSGLGERSHLAADGVTLTTHVDDVVNEITWNDLDRVVLVGHSYGGMVITAAAERIRQRIAAIVYLDAFMPSDGESVASYRRPTSAPLPTPAVPSPPAAFFKVNEKDAAWVNSKLTAQPTKCFTEAPRLTDAYQTIPKKVYVRAPAFRQPTFDAAYARCRADRTWKTLEMTCGHDVMLDQPAELAAMLNGLA